MHRLRSCGFTLFLQCLQDGRSFRLPFCFSGIVLLSQLEHSVLAVIVIDIIGELILRADFCRIDAADHSCQLMSVHRSVILQEQQLMDRRRQNKEAAAELFSRFIQESRIGKHACATVHGLHGCHIERRLTRIRSRHRKASHHVTEHFLHGTKRCRMGVRCILQCILLDLIGSHAESVQDRLVHSGGHHHAALRMKIQPEHDCHILYVLMRNGRKHGLVSFLRDQLREEHFLCLFIADAAVADS